MTEIKNKNLITDNTVLDRVKNMKGKLDEPNDERNELKGNLEGQEATENPKEKKGDDDAVKIEASDENVNKKEKEDKDYKKNQDELKKQLNKLKINEKIIEERVQYLISKGIPEEDAKKIANLEEMKKVQQIRENLLSQIDTTKDKEKRIENNKKGLDQTKKELEAISNTYKENLKENKENQTKRWEIIKKFLSDKTKIVKEEIFNFFKGIKESKLKNKIFGIFGGKKEKKEKEIITPDNIPAGDISTDENKVENKNVGQKYFIEEEEENYEGTLYGKLLKQQEEKEKERKELLTKCEKFLMEGNWLFYIDVLKEMKEKNMKLPEGIEADLSTALNNYKNDEKWEDYIHVLQDMTEMNIKLPLDVEENLKKIQEEGKVGLPDDVAKLLDKKEDTNNWKNKILKLFKFGGKKDKKEKQEKIETPEEKARKEEIKNKILNETIQEREQEVKKSNFFALINKTTDWWKNIGKDENGIEKGDAVSIAKRVAKMGVNLAIIGLLSSGSVEKLAEMGIGSASALAGGTTSYLARKLGFGLAIGTAMELSKKLTKNPKVKKVISVAITTAALGTGLALGGGFLVPAVALTGMGASYILQKTGNLTEEKIEELKKRKTEKLLKKHSDEELGTEADKIQKEISEKVLKYIERTKFINNLLKGTAKLGLSVAVSTALLSSIGVAKDELASNNNGGEAGTGGSNSNTEQEGEAGTGGSVGGEPKTEEEMAVDNTEEKPDSTNTLQQGESVEKELETQDETEQEEDNAIENIIKIEKETFTFEKGAGAIKGIQQLQKAINDQFDDMSKAPKSIQEFMEDNPTKTAIKLGLYDPMAEKESSLIIEGSSISVEENGSITFHDIQNNKDIILIDKEGNINEYTGKMFDSDLNNQKESNDNNDNGGLPKPQKLDVSNEETSNLDNEGDNETNNEELRRPEKISDINEPKNQEQVDDQKDTAKENTTTDKKDGTVKSGEGEKKDQNNESTGPKQKENLEKNLGDISAEDLKEIEKNYEEIKGNVFNNREIEKTEWNNSIENSKIKPSFILNSEEKDIQSKFHKMQDFMQALKKESNEEPIENNLLKTDDTIKTYIIRALQKINKMGKLEEFLKNYK